MPNGKSNFQKNNLQLREKKVLKHLIQASIGIIIRPGSIIAFVATSHFSIRPQNLKAAQDGPVSGNLFRPKMWRNYLIIALGWSAQKLTAAVAAPTSGTFLKTGLNPQD